MKELTKEQVAQLVKLKELQRSWRSAQEVYRRGDVHIEYDAKTIEMLKYAGADITGVHRIIDPKDEQQLRQYFLDRGLTDKSIDEIGVFFTKDAYDTGHVLGYKSAVVSGRRLSPASCVPIRDFSGEIVSLSVRLLIPWYDDYGKLRKCWFPYGIPAKRLFAATNSDARLSDPSTEYVILTEGVTRAVAFDQAGKCAFGLASVNGWNRNRTQILIDDLLIRLTRIQKIGTVVIGFDSDSRYNDNVRIQVAKLARALRREGLIVLAAFPDEHNLGEKLGWDDALVRDGIAAFDRAVAEAREKPEEKPHYSEKQALDHAKSFLGESSTPVLIYGYAESWWKWVRSRNCYARLKIKVLECMVRDYLNARFSGVMQTIVNEVIKQLESLTHVSTITGADVDDIEPPIALRDLPGNFADVKLTDCFFAENITIHTKKARHTLMPTWKIFNVNASRVPWDPSAGKSDEWAKIKSDAWPGDEASQLLLDEICGSFLTSDTSWQKIFMIIGASGSSKGTITRLISHIFGKKSVATFTMSSIASRFGKQDFIGKSIGICHEARLSDKHDHGEGLNTILSVSGEDELFIDIKGKEPVSLRVPMKMLVTCNEPPIFKDASSALARRLVVLEIKNPVAKVDRDLEKKLQRAATKVLNDFFDGLDRRNAQGDYTKRALAEEEVSIVDQISYAGAPVRLFGEQECVFDPGYEVDLKTIHPIFVRWSALRGSESMGQDKFADAFARIFGIKVRRPRNRPGRPYVCVGVALRVSHQVGGEPEANGSAADRLFREQHEY